jgi:hypothetical protein
MNLLRLFEEAMRTGLLIHPNAMRPFVGEPAFDRWVDAQVG